MSVQKRAQFFFAVDPLDPPLKIQISSLILAKVREITERRRMSMFREGRGAILHVPLPLLLGFLQEMVSVGIDGHLCGPVWSTSSEVSDLLREHGFIIKNTSL